MKAVNANSFAKCAPAISTDIKYCGTVTQCNAKPITADELTDSYTRSGEFKVMDALFKHDMEIKMCEAVQNGLYDFLMANKVNMSKRMHGRPLDDGTFEIAPFVMARQYSPINNEYWNVTRGQSTVVGGVTYWQVYVKSTTNIPSDVRSFPAGLRVNIDGQSQGGSATHTAWSVVSSTLDASGAYVILVLQSQNSASHFTPDKLGSPVNAGILSRGTPNVNDYEKMCAEHPAYINWKNVPFWGENTRNSLCRSELYDKWKRQVLTNDYYKEFFNLPEIEKNKQIGMDFQKRLVNQMFYGKPLPYQNAFDYSQLDDITAFDGGTLGVEGGRCVGKRANMVGVMEQLAECGRIFDLQGGKLNIPALARELYNMMRVKDGRGEKNSMMFDIFTDSVTAELLNQGFLAYYISKSQNTMRLNVDGEGYSIAKKANFGFLYRSYSLFWPQGVTVNVITHKFFDDKLSAASVNGASFENTARVLWVLNFAGIYPGILASNRYVSKTGDQKTLAAINPDFACVPRTNWVEWTHYTMAMTMVVECPAENLIIENIAAVVPEAVVDDGKNYGGAVGTTTTTTTQTTYWNVAQSYTATVSDCPAGTTVCNNCPQTVTVPANTYASTVSQNDANAQALAAATAEAKAAVDCQ